MRDVANRVAVLVDILTNVAAVVGEGVVEVGGTAILKSTVRRSTFSRLLESLLNTFFSFLEYNIISRFVPVRSKANGGISYMLKICRFQLPVGRYTCCLTDD